MRQHNIREQNTNAGRRANLFYMTMPRKRLGLNRHQTRLHQLENTMFESTAVAVQAPSDDGDPPPGSLFALRNTYSRLAVSSRS